jgi:hypothetical protein
MDLRKEIAHLRSLTPELNAVTDNAAKIILAVEHFLTEECQLGLPVVVSIQEGDRDNGTTTYGTRLEYTRWEGKYRICVSSYEDHDGYETEVTDRNVWVNCTRDRKLDTIMLVPRLLQEVSQKVKRVITHTKEQSAEVEAYLKQLGIKGVDQ